MTKDQAMRHTAPSAIFEGYVDGMPRIKWCGEPLPAGTVLYAGAPHVDAVQAVPEAREKALESALTGMVHWFGKYPEFIPDNEHFDKYMAVVKSARAALASPSPAVPPAIDPVEIKHNAMATGECAAESAIQICKACCDAGLHGCPVVMAAMKAATSLAQPTDTTAGE